MDDSLFWLIVFVIIYICVFKKVKFKNKNENKEINIVDSIEEVLLSYSSISQRVY